MRWPRRCPWHILGSSRAMRPPHAGFVVTLTLLFVSMVATASVKLLNDCSTFEQTPRQYTKTGFSIGIFHRVSCVLCAPFVSSRHVSHLPSAFCFAFSGWMLSQRVMDRFSSSSSTATSIDDYSEHSMWNPLLELLFLKHVNGIVDSYLVDLDLVRIACSCHFALDLLCYKEEVFVSTRWYIGHHCPWNF